MPAVQTGAPSAPASRHLPERDPEPGELVQVRTRRWLVDEVAPPPEPGHSARVRLACADDDAQGRVLEVFWDCEPDRRILAQEGWADLGARGFDTPRRFAAFLHTLRWNAVTATDPNLFQAPFRAGIMLDAYQMEPLRKALHLPRVNLFIADDTGLGKTIEAGLIARELLLRRKAKTIVVAAPASVLEQWKAEMEDRFGLLFEVLDRAYLTRMRRERGFGVNPWRTHSRFLVSHNLLIDPVYADPLREWLGPLRPGSLLILDEAHHAAPSSGGRYGIETKFTRAVRDVGGRFEHRLFLSATPHNGHSNSFSTLLELLDPARFTRGVPVAGRRALDDVMVRRLKEDVREMQGGFPRRVVNPITIDGLPDDAPELLLSRLLDDYRAVREQRHAAAPAKARAAAALLVVGLQQRLLSSVEAFARSLAVHRRTLARREEAERRAEAAAAESGGSEGSDGLPGGTAGYRTPATAVATGSAAAIGDPGDDGAVKPDPSDAAPAAPANAVRFATAPEGDLFTTTPGADDERADWTPDELDAEEDRQVAEITVAAESGAAGAEAAGPTPAGRGRAAERATHLPLSGGDATGDKAAAPVAAGSGNTAARPSPGADADALRRRERELLDRMQRIAEAARGRPDARTLRLIDWLREHLCPGLPPFGEPPAAGAPPARWNDRRGLIFTENREGTKRWLRKMLEAAIAATDRAAERIATIDGLTAGARRREVQRRFNAPPADDPLRILLATDAAREGLNFQAHCTDLFHFDLPWNPGRIEQRNGRIDRRLQPAPEVRCHYFVLPQRAEDRVLDVLVRKTGTIRRELGSLSQVIDDDVERRLRGGIRRGDADQLARDIERADLDARRRRAVETELESARDRQADLAEQIDRCRTLLDRSRGWTAFEPAPFRDALSCALELTGAPPLAETRDARGEPVWTFPPLDGQAAGDRTWTATLDSLRAPRRRGQPLAEWRRDAPIRPVVFADAGRLTDDTVHLHLEQRVAQRLLARFRTQGFVHHDLSRACLAQAADAIPRVLLLGRLSLYGQGAERLHEEIVPVTARWVEPSRRAGPLAAYARDAEARTLDLLERALARGDGWTPAETVRHRLLDAAARDVEELRPRLEARARETADGAARRLTERGAREARDLRRVLVEQRARVEAELRKHERADQLALDFSPDERRELQANMAAWRRRLDRFAEDAEREPARVEAFYRVQARRVEPVGLVYLWPESN